MKKVLVISCLLMALFLGLAGVQKVSANTDYQPKLFELRGVWVATVSNIDIKKQFGTTETQINQYKQQYIDILDTLERYNINTVFFQVRPANDAFYRSEYNAWSMFLLGDGRDPGWDPLEWMIEETHKRGMEFHAWLNPYRVSASTMTPNPDQTVEEMKWSYIQYRQQQVEGQNIKNPLYRKVTEGSPEYKELMEQFVYGLRENKIFLNPAKQTTIDFITDTVEEIMVKYEVDGIHFDDYFYPSGGIETAIENKDYAQYGAGMTLNEWRRSNVDRMVKAVHDAVKEFNNSGVRSRKVRFGISPAAVWASGRLDAGSRYMPGGMDVPGVNYSSYFDLHADTRKWVLEEWIDYILPQCYMDFSYEGDYRAVVNWWANTVSQTNVKLYIGLAPYRYAGDSPWKDPEIIQDQLLYNSRNQNISGAVLFSYKNLPHQPGNNVLNAANYYVRQLWSRKALTPIYAGDQALPVASTEISGSRTSYGHQVFFDEKENALGYVLYRYGIDETVTDSSDKIYKVFNQTTGSKRHRIDVEDTNDYKYVLKIVDKSGAFQGSQNVYLTTDFPQNQAPVISNLVIFGGNNQLPLFTKVPITFEVRDNESESVQVTLEIYEGTRRHLNVTLTPKNGNQYEYMWETLPIEVSGLIARVTAFDGSDQTVLESAPFDIVIARHEKPTGYKIKVEDNKVIITNATGLEFSFDGKNYFDETEFDAPDTKEFDLYIRVKKSGDLEASLPVIEKVKVSSGGSGSSCQFGSTALTVFSTLSLAAIFLLLRKRG